MLWIKALFVLHAVALAAVKLWKAKVAREDESIFGEKSVNLLVMSLRIVDLRLESLHEMVVDDLGLSRAHCLLGVLDLEIQLDIVSVSFSLRL